MADDQLTLPLSTDDLITMVQCRYDQTGRDGADWEDYIQLRDAIPTMLERMRKLAEIERRRVSIPVFDLRDPVSVEKMFEHAGLTKEGKPKPAPEAGRD